MSEPEDVIFTYTEQQAIDDGVLNRPIKGQPVICSNAIMQKCGEIAASRFPDLHREDPEKARMNVLFPLLLDAVMAWNNDLREANANKTRMEWPVVLEHTCCGDVWIGPGESGIVVMFPSDY